MDTIFALLALCVGNSSVTWSYGVFFDLCLNKWSRVNNREAGDLRRHHTHYDVTVMTFEITDTCPQLIFLLLISDVE